MWKALFGQAWGRTWRHPWRVAGRTIAIFVFGSLALWLLQGNDAVIDEFILFLAYGIIGVLVLEASLFGFNLWREFRAAPGAFRTLRVINDPLYTHQIGNRWLLKIDEERWRRRPTGWVLSVHLTVENISTTRQGMPDFSIRSGALWNDDSDLNAAVLESQRELHSLPEYADPRQEVDSWLVAPLLARFEGGRPSYTVWSGDIGSNWHGFGRLDVPPRAGERLRISDAHQIATRLADWYRWGGSILDETRATEAMYQRNPNHWISALGGTEERARSKLTEGHWTKYRTWNQMVFRYLNDCVGDGYGAHFDGEQDSADLIARITRQREILDSYIAEFRQLAIRMSSGHP